MLQDGSVYLIHDHFEFSNNPPNAIKQKYGKKNEQDKGQKMPQDRSLLCVNDYFVAFFRNAVLRSFFAVF